MADERRYKVMQLPIMHNGSIYAVGENVLMTPAEAKRLGDMVTPMKADESKDDPAKKKEER